MEMIDIIPPLMPGYESEEDLEVPVTPGRWYKEKETPSEVRYIADDLAMQVFAGDTSWQEPGNPVNRPISEIHKEVVTQVASPRNSEGSDKTPISGAKVNLQCNEAETGLATTTQQPRTEYVSAEISKSSGKYVPDCLSIKGSVHKCGISSRTNELPVTVKTNSRNGLTEDSHESSSDERSDSSSNEGRFVGFRKPNIITSRGPGRKGKLIEESRGKLFHMQNARGSSSQSRNGHLKHHKRYAENYKGYNEASQACEDNALPKNVKNAHTNQKLQRYIARQRSSSSASSSDHSTDESECSCYSYSRHRRSGNKIFKISSKYGKRASQPVHIAPKYRQAQCSKYPIAFRSNSEESDHSPVISKHQKPGSSWKGYKIGSDSDSGSSMSNHYLPNRSSLPEINGMKVKHHFKTPFEKPKYLDNSHKKRRAPEAVYKLQKRAFKQNNKIKVARSRDTSTDYSSTSTDANSSQYNVLERKDTGQKTKKHSAKHTSYKQEPILTTVGMHLKCRGKSLKKLPISNDLDSNVCSEDSDSSNKHHLRKSLKDISNHKTIKHGDGTKLRKQKLALDLEIQQISQNTKQKRKKSSSKHLHKTSCNLEDVFTPVKHDHTVRDKVAKHSAHKKNKKSKVPSPVSASQDACGSTKHKSSKAAKSSHIVNELAGDSYSKATKKESRKPTKKPNTRSPSSCQDNISNESGINCLPILSMPCFSTNFSNSNNCNSQLNKVSKHLKNHKTQNKNVLNEKYHPEKISKTTGAKTASDNNLKDNAVASESPSDIPRKVGKSKTSQLQETGMKSTQEKKSKRKVPSNNQPEKKGTSKRERKEQEREAAQSKEQLLHAATPKPKPKTKTKTKWENTAIKYPSSSYSSGTESDEHDSSEVERKATQLNLHRLSTSKQSKGKPKTKRKSKLLISPSTRGNNITESEIDENSVPKRASTKTDPTAVASHSVNKNKTKGKTTIKPLEASLCISSNSESIDDTDIENDAAAINQQLRQATAKHVNKKQKSKKSVLPIKESSKRNSISESEIGEMQKLKNNDAHFKNQQLQSNNEQNTNWENMKPLDLSENSTSEIDDSELKNDKENMMYPILQPENGQSTKKETDLSKDLVISSSSGIESETEDSETSASDSDVAELGLKDAAMILSESSSDELECEKDETPSERGINQEELVQEATTMNALLGANIENWRSKHISTFGARGKVKRPVGKKSKVKTVSAAETGAAKGTRKRKSSSPNSKTTPKGKKKKGKKKEQPKVSQVKKKQPSGIQRMRYGRTRMPPKLAIPEAVLNKDIWDANFDKLKKTLQSRT